MYASSGFLVFFRVVEIKNETQPPAISVVFVSFASRSGNAEAKRVVKVNEQHSAVRTVLKTVSLQEFHHAAPLSPHLPQSRLLRDGALFLRRRPRGSWSGSSKTVAEEVRRLASGDILRLETVEPYPAEYRATTERAKKEREANARPPLKTALPDLSAYGTIVLAHPIWGGHMPMPVRTFLDAVDLSGKRVAHVTTHGGSGLGQNGWQGVRDLESVGVWLRRIGLVE